jgi:hypothetical protein
LPQQPSGFVNRTVNQVVDGPWALQEVDGERRYRFLGLGQNLLFNFVTVLPRETIGCVVQDRVLYGIPVVLNSPSSQDW